MKVKTDILVINGTSTSGKSSVAKSLMKLNPNLIEEDLDLMRNPTTPTTPEMEFVMINNAIDHVLKGKQVILHLFHPSNLSKCMTARGIEDISVKKALMFCPIEGLVDRLDERNIKALKGDAQNTRDYLMPFDQFSKLYTKTLEKQIALETLSLEKVTKIYGDQFDKMIQYAKQQKHNLPSEDQILIDKQESLKEFLANLGFEESLLSIEIAPRETWDFIYNTYNDYCDEEGLTKIAGDLYVAFG